MSAGRNCSGVQAGLHGELDVLQVPGKHAGELARVSSKVIRLPPAISAACARSRLLSSFLICSALASASARSTGSASSTTP